MHMTPQSCNDIKMPPYTHTGYRRRFSASKGIHLYCSGNFVWNNLAFVIEIHKKQNVSD